MGIILYKVSFKKEAMAQMDLLLETKCAITILFDPVSFAVTYVRFSFKPRLPL